MKASGDEDLVNRVRKALTGIPKVKERRMFGSTGFMMREKALLRWNRQAVEFNRTLPSK